MNQGIPGLPVGIIVAGGVLIFSGLFNQSLGNTLGSLLTGKVPAKGPQSVSQVSTTASVVSSSGSPSSASAKANEATGRLMAGSYGWATGAEWTALNNIVMAESGWSSSAQNPGSSAYGIGQFLDSTWASVGYTKSGDPVVQIAAMLAYIKQRYGDPVKAWAFHLANGYY